MIKYIAIVLGLLFFSSCYEKDTVSRQARVEEALRLKIEKYEKTQLKECRQGILEDAQLFVDSLVLIEFNELDSVASPPRPERPKLETKIVLNDSIKIEPINTLR